MTSAQEHTSDAPNSPMAPDTILQDRYRIVRQLGRGGMGAVYEAVDQRLGITVALKETLSSESSMRKQFEQEARLLASMQHPALPRVSDHFVEGNRAFLVMQFIGGVDLARIIAQQPGPFPRDQVVAWADQLLDALIYLHSRDRQVIHRDIKPHNLKLTASGQIALLDFGLAKSQPADNSVTCSHAFFGYTRHYAPLEQIQDQRTGPRSDIYALGATLYHLLTGIKPPDALVRATAFVDQRADPLQPADRIHPAVGPEISAILSKAMAQKADDRYASANEFREAFRRIGRAKPITVPVNTPVSTKTIHIDSLADSFAPRPAEHAVVKMAMVESSRRFGPGAITAVLVFVLTVTVLFKYGSPEWFSGTETIAAPSATTTAVTSRQAAVPRKQEKARVADNAGEVISKTRSAAETKPVERLNVKKEVAAATVSQSAQRRVKDSITTERRKSPKPIAAPGIRLPRPELRNDSPAPSPESRVRMYSSTLLSPKFFRAPDGSLIVKFPDGSTRVVKPGERNAR